MLQYYFIRDANGIEMNAIFQQKWWWYSMPSIILYYAYINQQEKFKKNSSTQQSKVANYQIQCISIISII